MTRPLIIGDDRGVRRIVTDKYRVPVRPTAVAFNPLLDRPGGNECNFLRSYIICQATERDDVVDDPNAAAMSGEDQIVLARLNRQIADRHRREMVAFELGPAFSAIDRHPQ